MYAPGTKGINCILSLPDYTDHPNLCQERGEPEAAAPADGAWHNRSHVSKPPVAVLALALSPAARGPGARQRQARAPAAHPQRDRRGRQRDAAQGPKDIVSRTIDHRCDRARPGRDGARRSRRPGSQADAVIDATGKYVLPGLINAHAHLQDERGGTPQPIEYELKIWLACGITTDPRRGQRHQASARLRATQSAEGQDRRAAHLHLPACSAGRRTPTRRAPACARSRRWAPTASRSSASIATSCRRWRTRRTSSGCASRTTSASKRPTPGTTSTSARPASSTGTAFPTRRSRAACRTFRPSYNYNNETDRFR